MLILENKPDEIIKVRMGTQGAVKKKGAYFGLYRNWKIRLLEQLTSRSNKQQTLSVLNTRNLSKASLRVSFCSHNDFHKYKTHES